MIARTFKRLVQLGKVTGAISFLLAVPYALLQYIQSREAARVERTLDMFKAYNASPFILYREKLTKVLLANKEKIDQASRDESEYRDLQFQMLRQADAETEFLLLLDFFDGLAVCVQSGLCDNDTAIKLFKPRAADININFYQYIVARRGERATRHFGAGVEAVATSSLAKSSSEF